MDITSIVNLANLNLTATQTKTLSDSFSGVLDLVNHIKELDTAGVETTSQVTGLTNVTRTDVVDHSRVLTQVQALSNSPSSYNGYFVVNAVFQDL